MLVLNNDCEMSWCLLAIAALVTMHGITRAL